MHDLAETSVRKISIIAGALFVGLLAAHDAGAQEPAETAVGTTAETPVPEMGADYSRELLTIEEQVNGLKERVFRSKATLQLLKEIVVQGSSSGSRGKITHINKLSRSYSIESISYYLDGQGKFSKVDTSGALGAQKELAIFDGPIPPGNHNLTVHLKLRGNGFGVFSYVSNYVFNVQASTSFTAEDGKSCKVKSIIDERGGIARSFTERPSVKFETRCMRLAEDAGEE
jgi:hypothetical protein